MNKIVFLVIVLIFIFSIPVFGQETLPLDEFIQTSIKTNPKFQISVEEYLAAIEDNNNVHSMEDWNLVASAIYQDAHPAPISGFSASYQKTQGYSLGIEKYFPQTGTAISIEHANTRIDANYPSISIPGVGNIDFNPASPYYISNVSISIVQPLLKDAFGLASKNILKMSEYGLELAKIKLSEDWEDFIAYLNNEYTDWQKNKRNYDNYSEKVKRVEKQLALLKKQAQFGLSEKLDIVQMEQKLQAYKIMLEQSEMAYESQTHKILKYMNKTTAQINSISPETLKDNGQTISKESALYYLEKDSNIKKTTDLLVAIQQANFETKQNAKHMDVSLIAKINPNSFSHKFTDSMDKIGTYQENTITINASRPLFNQKAESEAKKADREYQKSIKQREEIILNSQIGLSNLYTNLEFLNKMLLHNEKNLKLAQQRLALEKAKYNQGRSSIFFVLQAEDDLLQAENTYYDLVYSREKLVNQIKVMTDRHAIEYKYLIKTEG